MTKRTLLPLALLAAVSVIFVLFVGATSQKPEPISVHRNIFYVDKSQNPFQQLDLYVPEGEGPFPVVVWIHGGAWVAGDKNHPLAVPLMVSQGFAVASINYRLAQHEPHPAQINDCKEAVRWLRKHAAQYKLDPNKIGAWGHSAGGHLTALLGTTGDIAVIAEGNEPKDEKRETAVQAACDWAGPTDFASIPKQQGPDAELDFNDPNGPLAILMAGNSQAARNGASPVNRLSSDDAPLLIVHGKRDTVVPSAQSSELADKMTAAGLKVECLIVPDEGHTLSSRTAVERTIEFFKKNLQSSPDSPTPAKVR